MASVSTYLNFARNTEEAFNFYKSVFGTEFEGEITRFSSVPPQPGQPPVSEEDKNLVMHIALPTVGGHKLHGTDAPESMGFTVTPGNNMYIMLEPDTKEEADRLFKALSEGGEVEMEMAEQFWGDYFGSCKDKYKTCWMINVLGKK
jgi:PhnB protein